MDPDFLDAIGPSPVVGRVYTLRSAPMEWECKELFEAIVELDEPDDVQAAWDALEGILVGPAAYQEWFQKFIRAVGGEFSLPTRL